MTLADVVTKAYGGAAEIQGVLGENVDGPGTGQLPFTGFDLILVYAAGVALVVCGVLLRRFAREA